MNLPQRHPNHIIESKSWKILQAAIPAHWILRDITERDYGIDAYLELVTNDGFVTGHLVSLQLKGKEQIDWKDGIYRFSGTSVDTVNYWMKLPVPVFLCVADTTASRVWFANVKAQVRRNYAEFISQKTLTFSVSFDHEMGTRPGMEQFVKEYDQEYRHDRSEYDLTSLFANCSRYAEFCEERFHRDCHLPVEQDNLMFLAHMHGVTETVARHLGIPWGLKSMAQMYQEDRTNWKDSSYDLHESTACEFVKGLAPKLIEILRAAQEHVTSTYAEYWKRTNYPLYRACLHGEFQHLVSILSECK
jgi:hypothetical protein